jgi:UDPglucose 6-dehydrogenase
MRVSLIGTGYVGLVTGVCFAEKGHDVCCVDADAAKIARLRRGESPIYEPGLDPLLKKHLASGRLRFSESIADGVAHGAVIFIAVGTPPAPDGAADLSQIEAVAREIARHIREYRVIVEKSTVPVETGERVKRTIAKAVPPGVPFDVASNPEFLREGSAIADALKPDRIVIGCDSPRAEGVLRELYAGFDAPLLATDMKSAELIKHASNSFLALKISYINAVAALCEKVGANVAEVARGMGLDRRIGPQFLHAGLGYGGSCFPKDVAAFARMARDAGTPIPFLDAVQEVNREARERFVKKIEEELWVLKGKTVALWGLSFKPDTDDIRESPALAVAAALLERGAAVKAHDPQAMEKARAALPALVCCPDPYAAAAGADGLVLATEWDVFRNADLTRLKSVMRHPTVIDGRNLFDPAALRAAGFTYRSVGRL